MAHCGWSVICLFFEHKNLRKNPILDLLYVTAAKMSCLTMMAIPLSSLAMSVLASYRDPTRVVLNGDLETGEDQSSFESNGSFQCRSWHWMRKN